MLAPVPIKSCTIVLGEVPTDEREEHLTDDSCKRSNNEMTLVKCHDALKIGVIKYTFPLPK